MDVTTLTNVSAVSVLNPCINPAFQPPIYTLSNISVIKTFERDYGGDDNRVSESFHGNFSFSVRDIANNYSLFCTWGQQQQQQQQQQPQQGKEGSGYGYASGYNDWGWTNCIQVDPVTGTGSGTGMAPSWESRITTLLNLDSKALLRNRSRQIPVRMAQFWGCDVGVNGSYP